MENDKMYKRKVRINLFRVVFALVVGISDGRASTLSQLSNKTYTLTFSGMNEKFRFYIDTAGRVFQYANDPDHDSCPSVGTVTKLNASNRGQVQFSCYMNPGLGTLVVSYSVSARLSGSTITYEGSSDWRSSTGAPLNPQTWRWVFSTDGARCDAVPVLFNNQSFPAISCEVSAGRPLK
jgi:hypothetical protein